jgi:pimeloyl-ACP methyl ester carboxylesterase
MMPNVQVHGLDIYYEIHGEGRPLLLILGLGSDLSQYTRIIKRLARKHQVIAFDNRGSGRSAKPDSPYSMDMMADDAIALMKSLAIDKADVVGISMGGRIALSIALNYPDQVDRLALVCTGPHYFSRIKISLPLLLLLPIRQLPPIRRKYPQPRFAYLRQREATFNFEVGEKLSVIQTPTVILHGIKDQTALYTNAIEMHDKIKNSTLVTFRGGHLFFMLGERQKFLDELTTFLAT